MSSTANPVESHAVQAPNAAVDPANKGLWPETDSAQSAGPTGPHPFQVTLARQQRTVEVAAGTRIVAVRIDRHDIYDLSEPATSAWPYRWVDALHILTREEFIGLLKK